MCLGDWVISWVERNVWNIEYGDVERVRGRIRAWRRNRVYDGKVEYFIVWMLGI